MSTHKNNFDGIGGSVSIDSSLKQNINILTIQEVADLLRVHRSTISRYATCGELKSYIIGNRRLFKEKDVLQFFENRIDRVALKYVSY